MAKRPNLMTRARTAWTIFDAARAAAARVESGRKPDPRDLERLGMDPEAFTRLG